MKKFFQSKGFIVSSLALLCVTILGVCWFVSRDRTGDFRPDESPPSSVTGDWSDGGTQTDGDNGADAYAPGQSTDAEEEYPKVEAYPIIVFTKQLEDRSRKIMEIIEGEDYQDGRLIAHSLYKYEVEDNVTDDRGETRVVGHHKKIGLISDSLKKRLLDNGISNKELEEFMQPPKEVS